MDLDSIDTMEISLKNWMSELRDDINRVRCILREETRKIQNQLQLLRFEMKVTRLMLQRHMSQTELAMQSSPSNIVPVER